MSKGIRISYLYLDQFRTITRSELSFDHRFSFFEGPERPNIQDNHIRRAFGLAGPYFYGNKVYSMSCIVGRNGEGKTSMVDFIHESFLLMIRDISTGYLEVDADLNTVVLSETDMDFYHLQRNTRFLVIFSLQGKDYFITNIGAIRYEGALCPFTREIHETMAYREYNISYFSMMRYRTGVPESEIQIGREADMLIRRRAGRRPEDTSVDVIHGFGDNTYLGIEELFGSKRSDLSEERIDYNRRKNIGENFDILVQLVFIYLRKDLAGACLGKNFLDRMQVHAISNEGGIDQSNIMVRDILGMNGSGKIDLAAVDRAFNEPGSYIRPFSSGQYSRFALLARLYWFFEGSEKIAATDFWQMFVSSAQFRKYEADYYHRQLDRESGTILLFDEGDLFYHPEWQREFVGDILRMVDECAGADVQIVFTTNSPFMMSDMLREDIVTLTCDRDKIDEDVLTFGQNIHTLLAHRFFLDSTIGSVSEETIGWLIALLADPKVEKDYVNRAVYEKYEKYCSNRGWGPLSDKSEFIEAIISSIGEEVYRKRLRYRYELYKERTPEITAEETEHLIKVLMETGKYESDPAVRQMAERLQRIADRGSL